jgi:hypothetical protein
MVEIGPVKIVVIEAPVERAVIFPCLLIQVRCCEDCPWGVRFDPDAYLEGVVQEEVFDCEILRHPIKPKPAILKHVWIVAVDRGFHSSTKHLGVPLDQVIRRLVLVAPMVRPVPFVRGLALEFEVKVNNHLSRPHACF